MILVRLRYALHVERNIKTGDTAGFEKNGLPLIQRKDITNFQVEGTAGRGTERLHNRSVGFFAQLFERKAGREMNHICRRRRNDVLGSFINGFLPFQSILVSDIVGVLVLWELWLMTVG